MTPLVRIMARSIVLNSRNLPYYVCFWATPPSRSADVLYVRPLLRLPLPTNYTYRRNMWTIPVEGALHLEVVVLGDLERHAEALPVADGAQGGGQGGEEHEERLHLSSLFLTGRMFRQILIAN